MFNAHTENIELKVNNIIQLGSAVEDENKYNAATLAHLTAQYNDKNDHFDQQLLINIDINNITIPSKYVEPREDDYTRCKGDISKCNAVNRVVHLLHYYKSMIKQNMQQENDSFINIFEYIMTLQNYSISKFMEDWYQCKKNHLKTEHDVSWFVGNNQINCNSLATSYSCPYTKRYIRQRTDEKHTFSKNTDHKNMILLDQLDAIHTFIFHFSTRRVKDVVDTEKIAGADIWFNYPECIEHCNLEQILFILNSNDIFKDLKKLNFVKSEIISYFQENNFNGKKLKEMNRKEFMKQIAGFMNNKKLTFELGKLYNRITKYILPKPDEQNNNSQQINSKNDNNIWSDCPTSVEQCNLQQIIFILNNENIFDKLNLLIDVKEKIISYFTENNFDGKKFVQTNRKDFMKQIAAFMNNKKMTLQLGKLYTRIKEYNLPQTDNAKTHNFNQNQITEKQFFINQKNTKFVTEITTELNTSKVSYYSFGQQYKYTANFKEHPLFVTAKYNNIKEELFQYFRREREEKQKYEDDSSQHEDIAQSVLNDLIKFNSIPYDTINAIWKGDIQDDAIEEKYDAIAMENIKNEICKIKSNLGILKDTKYINLKKQSQQNTNLIELLQVQYLNWMQLMESIPNLCKYSHNDFFSKLINEFENFVGFIFRNILDFFVEQFYGTYQNKIRQKLVQIGINKIDNTTLKFFLRKYLNETFQDDLKARQFVDEHVKQYISDLSSGRILHTSNLSNFKVISKIVSKYYKQMYVAEHQKKWQHSSFVLVAKSWSEHRRQTNTSFWSELKIKLNKEYSETGITFVNATTVFYKKMQCLQSTIVNIFGVKSDGLLSILLSEHLDAKAKLMRRFIEFSRTTLLQALKENQTEYINLQIQQQCQIYIVKAEAKSEMPSVKQMKATRHYSINKHHRIHPNDPINIKHIIALICYSDISALCTKFRETYRVEEEKYDEEAIHVTKKKHSIFANMGRLLYESFVFYASTDCKIRILYHGMSQQLSFSTLFCSFIAPTS
eukprot:89163_1